jgi:hypothetical protein
VTAAETDQLKMKFNTISDMINSGGSRYPNLFPPGFIIHGIKQILIPWALPKPDIYLPGLAAVR